MHLNSAKIVVNYQNAPKWELARFLREIKMHHFGEFPKSEHSFAPIKGKIRLARFLRRIILHQHSAS